jgi:hypothetical protein
MPYIPRENAGTLREVALKLREAGISTTTLFHAIYGTKHLMGRATFDRFVKTENIKVKKVSELARIWVIGAKVWAARPVRRGGTAL